MPWIARCSSRGGIAADGEAESARVLVMSSDRMAEADLVTIGGHWLVAASPGQLTR
jgi:hypothetical protein